jgi:hypothetical protein
MNDYLLGRPLLLRSRESARQSTLAGGGRGGADRVVPYKVPFNLFLWAVTIYFSVYW